MRINTNWFLCYKTLNNLFAGLSLGAIIAIYAPLDPKIFSIGGIILAIGSMLIALIYSKIINVKCFFFVTIAVEIIVFSAALLFLINPAAVYVAGAVYFCYQLTFLFGSYLVRSETLFLSEINTLTKLDSLKQIGYLIGLATSLIYYEISDAEKLIEIWRLHFAMIVAQTLTIVSALKAFESDAKNHAPQSITL
ncbi:MAG: hypothetical protein LBU73_09125 [Helicobacteraceae bacterium]|jgi:hypothetical protein|nr:hypothetical protein [Helicobacteraceae bacterium]